MQISDDVVRVAAKASRRVLGLYGDPPPSSLKQARAAIEAALAAMNIDDNGTGWLPSPPSTNKEDGK